MDWRYFDQKFLRLGRNSQQRVTHAIRDHWEPDDGFRQIEKFCDQVDWRYSIKDFYDSAGNSQRRVYARSILQFAMESLGPRAHATERLNRIGMSLAPTQTAA